MSASAHVVPISVVADPKLLAGGARPGLFDVLKLGDPAWIHFFGHGENGHVEHLLLDAEDTGELVGCPEDEHHAPGHVAHDLLEGVPIRAAGAGRLARVGVSPDASELLRAEFFVDHHLVHPCVLGFGVEVGRNGCAFLWKESEVKDVERVVGQGDTHGPDFGIFLVSEPEKLFVGVGAEDEAGTINLRRLPRPRQFLHHPLRCHIHLRRRLRRLGDFRLRLGRLNLQAGLRLLMCQSSDSGLGGHR